MASMFTKGQGAIPLDSHIEQYWPLRDNAQSIKLGDCDDQSRIALL